MLISDRDSWGAIFIARSGEGFDTDLADVTALGFSVLQQESFSGGVRLYCHGTGSGVGRFTNDFDLKYRIYGVFFPLPPNVEITPTLIRTWTRYENVIV